MAWVKLDDRLHTNARMAALSDAAFRLWTQGLTFAAGNATDGKIPESMLPLVWPTASPSKRNKAARELVAAGRWHQLDDGWEIHDFLEYNKSADEVENTTTVKSKAGTFGNHKRWHVKRNQPDPECEWCESDDRSHMRSQDRSQTDRRPVPTRPDPTENAGSGGSGDHGEGGVRGGAADFEQTLRTVAEEHADRREAENYTIRNREAFVRDLMKSPEVRNEAMKRTPPAGNVHELLDRIGKPIDGQEATG